MCEQIRVSEVHQISSQESVRAVNIFFQERISERMCEQIGVLEVPMISSQDSVEVNNLERVEQFKTRYQKHYANDKDELESYGFFKKSKTRVTKHDDQSKEHHHQRANLDHCEVDAWLFDPYLLCWTSGHVPDD